MQLPPNEEIVMVAGIPPIRATKARYFEDARFRERVLAPPELKRLEGTRPDDWTTLPIPARAGPAEGDEEHMADDEDPTESERRLQPELSRVKPVEKKKPIENEFEPHLSDDVDEDVARNRRMIRQVQGIARQVAMDPNDGMEL